MSLRTESTTASVSGLIDLQLGEQLRSAPAGHVNVQRGEVHTVIAEPRDRLIGIGRLQTSAAGVRQPARDQAADVRFVVHDQNGGCGIDQAVRLRQASLLPIQLFADRPQQHFRIEWLGDHAQPLLGHQCSCMVSRPYPLQNTAQICGLIACRRR